MQPLPTDSKAMDSTLSGRNRSSFGMNGIIASPTATMAAPQPSRWRWPKMRCKAPIMKPCTTAAPTPTRVNISPIADLSSP